MTTEKHDPWALLREAQGWIGYWPLTKPEAGAEILKKRIDAALAEHDSVLSSKEFDESKAIWRAYVNRELSEDEAKAKLAALEAP